MGICDVNEKWEKKQTTYFIKKDKANGQKDKAGSLKRKKSVFRIKFPQEDL
jgi:hypothetical protein